MTPALYLVAVYMVLQLSIGVYISRRIRTESDYLIAGRNLGYTLATFSIFATWFGAESIVGSAGNAYTNGVSLASAEPFGYGLCLILMGLIFAVPLWRRRLTTLADLFRERYSVTVERVAAVILVPSSILWAAAQVRAFGQIIASASGGWNVELAIGIAALFTIAYTMFGGLLVDAIGDVLQGVVVVVGLTVLFVATILQFGGPDGFVNALQHSRGIAWLPPERVAPLALAEEWAIPILGSVVATELVGRIIATRTPAVARSSSIFAALLYLGAGTLPLLIGLSASGFGINVADAEQIIPTVARELLPTLAYAAFVGAIISAILSTVDSTLLTASGLLSHNLIVPIARISRERTKVILARAGVLAFGAIAYTLALSAEGVYSLVEQASALGSSGTLVVICFGLFTRFGGAHAALATLLIGTTAYVALSFTGVVAPFLYSVGLSVITYVVIGAIEGKRRGSSSSAEYFTA
jgi:SSS family solute:Na+ symporter